MNYIKEQITKLFKLAIKLLGYDKVDLYNLITTSNRPDLSAYQCNIALTLAKVLKQNPMAIATNIKDKVKSDDIEIDVAPPGFINIKVSDNFIASAMSKENILLPTKTPKKKIIVDYGGPNVAKALHVGHLRASIIGEALKNLAKFMGHEVIGDIHMGDWGLPMGMIIAAIKQQNLSLPLSVDDLNKIYPAASQKSKDDEDFMKQAQLETKKLQNKDPENVAIWQSFRKTSTDDIKELMDKLGVEFDLWYGESNANDDVEMLAEKFDKEKISTLSNGAKVIFLNDYPIHGNEPPPFIVVKTNGAVMYGMTDIGTLYDRIVRQKIDEAWYVVDSRQALHFHQVFSVMDLIGLKGNIKLEHLGFGSVLGLDGKPLKTRSGENVPLRELIDGTIKYAKDKILENEKTRNLSAAEVDKIATDVGISAIKFADLINPRTNDYIFNMEKFVNFEGKTGPYILYTAVRIKSILKELESAEKIEYDNIIITNKSDRALCFKILDFKEILQTAFDERAINILVQYVYELSVIFNDFYHNCKIKQQSDEKIKKSWIAISQITLEIINIFAKIIKINIPEKM